jgi:hypothetical protein
MSVIRMDTTGMALVEGGRADGPLQTVTPYNAR